LPSISTLDRISLPEKRILKITCEVISGRKKRSCKFDKYDPRQNDAAIGKPFRAAHARYSEERSSVYRTPSLERTNPVLPIGIQFDNYDVTIEIRLHTAQRLVPRLVAITIGGTKSASAM
jgi:hypothetical protein